MYHLRVLGGFTLTQRAGAAMSALPLRRAEAALAVLAACGERGCTRERLIALLWPESDEAHSRHSLRDVLNVLRRALGEDVVLSAGEHLSLNPSVVTSDVIEFAQALTAGRLRDAVGAYGGSLLEGFHLDGAPTFERWLDGERARLGREYAEALEELATTAERSAAWSEAASWWARAVEHDPVNSRVVLRHLNALAVAGDRANALKAADAHLRRLREELDLEPDREVLTGIERIRRGELGTPPASGQPGGHGPAAIKERLHEELERAEHLAERVAELTAPGAPPSGTSLRARRLAWGSLAVLAVVVGALAVRQWPAWHASVRYPRTAIAVLPFQNLSADSAHAYFAGGLHDALLTQLAKVSTLKVIGRTSVVPYQGTSKSLRQIGEELEAGSIVEATVQVIGSRLRVIVQLIDPVSQGHLWGDGYDRTLGDAFAIESDIARQVAAAVGATLTSAEAGAISVAPTQNALAYQFYLQGLEYWRRPGEARGNLEAAQQLYERAVALDSAFALAHAALALVHGDMFIDSYDPSPGRLKAQEREARTALRLAPDRPQSHLAIAVLHYSREEYRQAVVELGVALRGAPGDAGIWGWLAYAYRRLGDWDSVLVAYDRAIRLDPRNVGLMYGKGYTLGWLHRYRDALAVYRQVLALAPDYAEAHAEIGWVYGKWQGQWDSLRVVFSTTPSESLLHERLDLFAMDHQPDSILAYLRVHRRQIAQQWAPSGAMMAAEAHLLRGDSAGARAAFGSAMVELDSLTRANPDDHLVHLARGLALAHLGRRVEALLEARWIEGSDAYRLDRFIGGDQARRGRAYILAAAGDTAAAIAEVERLLVAPGIVTAYGLERDPWLEPIRHDPRFQALLVKYANPEAR